MPRQKQNCIAAGGVKAARSRQRHISCGDGMAGFFSILITVRVLIITLKSLRFAADFAPGHAESARRQDAMRSVCNLPENLRNLLL